MRTHLAGVVVLAPLVVVLLVQTSSIRRSYPYTVLSYRDVLVVPSASIFINVTVGPNGMPTAIPDPTTPFSPVFPATCDDLLWSTGTYCLQPVHNPASQLHMFKTYGSGAIHAMMGTRPPALDTSCGFYPTVCPSTGIRNDACAVLYNTDFSDIVLSTGNGLAYCSSTPNQSSFFEAPLTCQSTTTAQLTCPLHLIRVCMGYAPGCELTDSIIVSQYDFFLGDGSVVTLGRLNQNATAAVTGNINSSAVYVNTSFGQLQANFDTMTATSVGSVQMANDMVCFPTKQYGIVRIVDPQMPCIPPFEFTLCSANVSKCMLELEPGLDIQQTACTVENCSSHSFNSFRTRYTDPFVASSSPNWTVAFDPITMGAIGGAARTGTVSSVSSEYVSTRWACVSSNNNHTHTAAWIVPKGLTCESALSAAEPTNFSVCIARVLYCDTDQPGYYAVSEYNLHTVYTVYETYTQLTVNQTSEEFVQVLVQNVSLVSGTAGYTPYQQAYSEQFRFPTSASYTYTNSSTIVTAYPLSAIGGSYTCITPPGSATPTVAMWAINQQTQSCLINGRDTAPSKILLCYVDLYGNQANTDVNQGLLQQTNAFARTENGNIVVVATMNMVDASSNPLISDITLVVYPNLTIQSFVLHNVSSYQLQLAPVGWACFTSDLTWCFSLSLGTCTQFPYMTSWGICEYSVGATNVAQSFNARVYLPSDNSSLYATIINPLLQVTMLADRTTLYVNSVSAVLAVWQLALANLNPGYPTPNAIATKATIVTGSSGDGFYCFYINGLPAEYTLSGQWCVSISQSANCPTTIPTLSAAPPPPPPPPSPAPPPSPSPTPPPPPSPPPYCYYSGSLDQEICIPQ